MRTDIERRFLARLAEAPKGRVGYSKASDFETVRPHLLPMIDDGLIVERRLGLVNGFQITPAGRAYLNPTGDQ